jgi:hypothetical protein
MYRGSRHLGKITDSYSPPISSNFRRWSAERVVRRGGIWRPELERPKRAVQKASRLQYIRGLPRTPMETNKQTNKAFAHDPEPAPLT